MARAKRAARHEAIITSLLVIAGIVLAICLFAAGLFWRGKPTTKRASAGGFVPVIGFSVGAITSGAGKYKDIRGTLTMRWDANVCIWLFDIVKP